MLPYWGTQWDGPREDLAGLNLLLQQVWPRSERAVWLLAYWEPGEFWRPGFERIVVAAMQPGAGFHAEDHFYRSLGYGSEDSKLAELNGPSPRQGAYFDSALGKLVRPASTLPPTISERQWLLWRQHGALALPIWIVQGGAGHPIRFSSFEMRARQARGIFPLQAPEIGALPYASGDRRTVQALDEWQEAQRLSKLVREDWFRIEPEDRTEPEQRLHAMFDDWYADGVENRLAPSAAAHAAFA